MLRNDLGNAHPALSSTFLGTYFSITTVTPRLLNISLKFIIITITKNIILIFCTYTSISNLNVEILFIEVTDALHKSFFPIALRAL
jgi:hypothetical protein